MTFFSINNSFLGKSNGLLLKCCFLAAPTPAPFTRILINSNIYIPLIVERHNKIFFNTRLVLIKFDIYEIRNVDKVDKEIKQEIFCYYANISNIGFVEGTIKDSSDLKDYKDVYLNDDTFDLSKAKDFEKYKETVRIKIDAEIAKSYFIKHKKKITKKILKEL